MAHYRHIVWDWNGTLLDDAWLCVDILNDMLERRGKPRTTLRKYRELFDFPVENYYARVGFDFDAEPFSLIAREWMDVYRRRRGECVIRPEARAFLQAACAAGRSQHVLSVYPQDELETAVAQFGLSRLFDRICGQNDICAVGKTQRGIELMAVLDAAPEEIVFVGDTTHDYEVARTMGVACVLVLRGHHSQRRLKACGAPVIASLAELRDITGPFERNERA